jgi:hypothetical protein
MAEIKAGSPFGMDGAMIKKIDWNLALKRVNHDLRTDFIYAPHLGFIYNRAGDELIAHVKSDLKNGQYSPGLPLTIEVPKSFRIRVVTPAKRLGPSFSRPGSILLPHDRLLYQALADQAAPLDKAKTVAAVFVGRFGDHARRKTIIAAYPAVSPYIQAAIYFSSRRWPSAERNTAKASWGSHGVLNNLVTAAIAKK